MREITLEELLEAGCHFGHQVTRQNPKARDYVFEARDNIHIIDLVKTKEGLEEAAAFVKELGKRNGVLVVIGTKRQARSIVEEEIKRARSSQSSSGQAQDSQGSIYSVTNRWIGGILTNFSEVAKNYKKLKDFRDRLQSEEEKAKFTKREVGQWAKEKQKLESFYGGIEDMKKLPDAMFIIDSHQEDLAVKEAIKMGVTTAGIVDTNADPTLINYPIPANDDAVGSIKLIVSYIIDAWIEGRKEGIKEALVEENKESGIKNQEAAKMNQESGIMNQEKKPGEQKGTKKKPIKKKTETRNKKIKESKAK
ncbi:MAG: 30S ribosomal protein S2 [Candidatus Levybacteria bacterium]|nr:30S ribosomal protein S2 [Candidatus Levybacteria bacterium]